MDLIEKLKYHRDIKKYVKIIREIPGSKLGIVAGYILQLSDDFVLIHETDDFKACGYIILPIWQITKLRSNKADKYYDKIIHWEKVIDKIGIDFKIDLKNYRTIFNTLKKRDFNIIVECEDPDIDTFTIGPIVKAGSKYVFIQYFDAEGYFDKDPISVNYTLITKVQFDEHYCNTISKYTRYRKE
ncbi:MAG: hypothetical protein ABIN91_03440 [Mucilaginibacter sp.]|uniref:hypothetical protein n=1 Tax=Mucilaginibacter sp. TaxID=1882438 RepID=UPI0032655652